MDANLGHNPSYTRSNIWSTKPLLTLGHRWTISDDSQINVWSMPWIHNLPTRKSISLQLVHHEDVTVNYLLNPGEILRTFLWYGQCSTLQMLHQSFLCLPSLVNMLSSSYGRLLLMVHTHVKPAYRIFFELITATFTTTGENCWNSIWKV